MAENWFSRFLKRRQANGGMSNDEKVNGVAQPSNVAPDSMFEGNVSELNSHHEETLEEKDASKRPSLDSLIGSANMRKAYDKMVQSGQELGDAMGSLGKSMMETAKAGMRKTPHRNDSGMDR